MRDILFKAQRVVDKEWVEGFLLQGINKDVMLIQYWSNERGYCMEDIIPETVGQFTGITDKNGVKIFEGDILLFGDKSFAVEWKNDIVGFGYFYTFDRLLGCDGINCVVIGNIHENPELLI